MMTLLATEMRPYVSDEAFESMAEADPFIQQEWMEWKEEQKGLENDEA